MTKADQKKLRVLIVLLIIFGVTVFFGYRMSRTPNPVVVQAQEQRPAAAPPVQTDARIRLDLIDKQDSNEEVGKKNLFEYGPPPAPPAPPKPVTRPPGPPTNLPGNPTPGAPNVGPVRPPPPPTPSIPLKYIGFAYVEPNAKALIAALLDDAQHHFTAVKGDVLMGRYRIADVTDTAVEVEDMEFNRHQRLPLVKQ